MSRRNPPAKWVLPTIVNPPGRRCFVINVPDEPYHIAAFWGALLDLAAGYKWADDTAHTAREVALVWRDVIDGIQTCAAAFPNSCIDWIETGDDDMQLRLKPGDPCIIQIMCAGDWQDWYDPRSCAAAGTAQPGAGGSLAAGQCQTYQAVLQGNGQWKLPIAVSEGYTIQIAGASGGWWDGGAAHWNCPNGQQYIAGLCAITDPAAVGDPMQNQPHMRLIYQVGTTWYDGYDTTLTIPAGVTNADVTFQANDSALGNNMGSVSFGVTVCAPATTIALSYNTSPVGGAAKSSGPASVESGGLISVTSDTGTAYQGATIYYVDMNFAPCSTFVVTAVAGATLFQQQPANNIPKNWVDCNGALQGSVTVQNGGTVVAAGYTGNAQRIIINSATPFTMTIRVTKV